MRYLWLAIKGIWIEYRPELQAVWQRHSGDDAGSPPLEGESPPRPIPQLLMQLLVFEICEHGNVR